MKFGIRTETEMLSDPHLSFLVILFPNPMSLSTKIEMKTCAEKIESQNKKFYVYPICVLHTDLSPFEKTIQDIDNFVKSDVRLQQRKVIIWPLSFASTGYDRLALETIVAKYDIHNYAIFSHPFDFTLEILPMLNTFLSRNH